ncbi:MAG: hypothetical protein LUH56_02990 [Oscillospiraceae bacterium]|nr:hypothetical protein [Oscillospiraceae bacterium]
MKIRNLKIKKTVAVFMCIMLFTLSTGCSELEGLNIDTSTFFSDPVTQVIEAVNLSEYSTANEIYNEKISGNLELEKEVESQLSEIISEAIDSYNNGEITYDDVAIILETIECAGIYNYTSLLNSYTELENLQESKNYYEEAVLLEGDGEYLEAHNVYSQVSSDDTNYESAQTKSEEVLETLLEKLIAEANEAVADSNYEYALYTMDRSCR